MTAVDRQLGMFAKHWTPGAVKTRLATQLSDAMAARLYRCFVTTLARRLAAISARRTVVYWPPWRAAEFQRAIGHAWQFQPQVEGDLGQRMQHYFEQHVGSGEDSARRVVLLGSDSPTIPLALVEQAFTCLKQFPVVLGPTHDGGYYLVGMTGSVPDIFAGIAWSTRHVWDQTTARLMAAGVSYGTLPVWYDVDTIDDLRRLRDELIGQYGDDWCYDELRTLVAAIDAR
jgi:rSAM/selenodomain-associated transferase 1